MGCAASRLSKNIITNSAIPNSDNHESVDRPENSRPPGSPGFISEGIEMEKTNCSLKDQNPPEGGCHHQSTGTDETFERYNVHSRRLSETSSIMEVERESDKNGVAVKPGIDLVILHFNDVYNIEPREKEPVGGAARFASKVASFKSRNPLIFFSGDALNPSMMSSVTKGEQMLPVLNALGIHAAVYGNHDFDFGVDELVDFASDCNFPWLMSNVYDKTTKRPLAEGETSLIIEWNGHKIGIIGLVEKEWLATLATLSADQVNYINFIPEGRRLGALLRKKGCDFIVALTHMRVPNDIKLAENVPEIDLILGGHDHHYEIIQINGTKIFKSGTDFRSFSEIEITFSDDGSFLVQSNKHEITKEVPEDPEIKMIVDKYVGIIEEKMEGTLGRVEVELDGRFTSVRTKETNLGNLIADITRNVTQADVGLVNSGTLRSDTIHPPGEFKMKDLVSILPMPDAIVVIALTGAQLVTALNNGVSQWPKLEGRFPQVSGITFAFDPDLPPGQRVIESSVKVGGKNIDLEQKYKLCTKSYISHGKDGYDVFKDCDVLVSEEEGAILPTIVRNHFVSCNIVKGLQICRSGHRQSITVLEPGEELSEVEKRRCTISPKVEGRIRIVYQQRNEEDGI